MTSSAPEVVGADLAVLPGVGSAAIGDGRLARARARRRRCASGSPRPAHARHLPRPPARARRERGGRRRAGLGLVPGRARRLAGGRVPRIGWAAVEPGGEAFYFAHSYAAESPPRRRRSEGIVAIAEAGRLPRRPVPPGEERRRGRAASCAAMPLPRLIPCLDVAGGRVVKGVRFQGLRDVGDPVELARAYSDAGADELVFLDVRATLEERARSRSSSPGRRPAGDPLHRRRRVRSAADAERCSTRAPTRSP